MEWPWVGVVLIDEGVDRGMERGDTAVDAAPDLSFRRQAEEAFDLIEPGRTGRGEMHMPARPPR
jgi:hypothetical protein